MQKGILHSAIIGLYSYTSVFTSTCSMASWSESWTSRLLCSYVCILLVSLALHLVPGCMLTVVFSDAWGHTPMYRPTVYIHNCWEPYLALHSDTSYIRCHMLWNALAVYTIHGLSACISKLCNGRESTQRESKKMESLRFLAVLLSTVLSGTVGNL